MNDRRARATQPKLPALPAGNLTLLAFGAICISFAPMLVKLIGKETLGPTAMGFWRTIMGAGIFYGIALATRQSIGLTPSVRLWGAAAGIAFACDLYCWHRAIFLVGSGMATILGNTQVFGTAILSYLLFKEKLSRKFFIAAITAIAGVALLVGVGGNVAFSSEYLFGVLLGWLTGVFYAFYIVTLKSAGHRPGDNSVIALMAWVSLCTAVAMGIVASFESYPFMPDSPRAYLLLFTLALVAQCIGWWSITTSLPHVRGAIGGLVLLLQPTFATIWGAWFFGERFTLLQIVGAAITLAAIFLGSMKERNQT